VGGNFYRVHHTPRHSEWGLRRGGGGKICDLIPHAYIVWPRRDLFAVINLLVIARQQAPAHRARYCSTISVRLSVRHAVVLYINMLTYRQTFCPILVVFLNPIAITKLQGQPSVSIKCMRCVKKLCEFRPKSPFISEAGTRHHSYYGSL